MDSPRQSLERNDLLQTRPTTPVELIEEPLFLPSSSSSQNGSKQHSKEGSKRPSREDSPRRSPVIETPVEALNPDDLHDRMSVFSFEDQILLGDEVQDAAAAPDRGPCEQDAAAIVDGPFDDQQQAKVVLEATIAKLSSNPEWMAEGRKRKGEELEEDREARRRLRRSQHSQAGAGNGLAATSGSRPPPSPLRAVPPESDDDEIEFVGHRQITPPPHARLAVRVTGGALATTDPWRRWTRREMRVLRKLYLKYGFERHPEDEDDNDADRSDRYRSGKRPPFNLVQEDFSKLIPPADCEPSRWYKDVLVRAFERDVALQEERILQEREDGEQGAAAPSPMAKVSPEHA